MITRTIGTMRSSSAKTFFGVALMLGLVMLLAACQGAAEAKMIRRAVGSDPQLKAVATAIASTGIPDELKDAEAITVFVPGRDALSSITATLTQTPTVTTSVTISDIVEAHFVRADDGLISIYPGDAPSATVTNSVTFTDLVGYHVVPGEHAIQDLSYLYGESIESITGQDIHVLVTGTTTITTSTGVLALRGRGIAINDTQIVTGDIPIGNGVVHIVRDVLFPPEVAESETEPGTPTTETPVPALLTLDQQDAPMVQQLRLPVQDYSIPLSLSLAPNVNGLKSGQSIAVSVVSPGWEKSEFEWEMSASHLGSLSSMSGPTAIFEASSEGPGPVTITVTGTQGLASGTSRVSFYVLGSEAPPSRDQVGLARLEGTTISFTCCYPTKQTSSCDEICTIDIGDKREVQLTDNLVKDFYSSPSPDGESILFSSRGDNFRILAIDKANAEPVQDPIEIPDHWLYAPDLSTSGDLILAAQNSKSGLQSIWLLEKGEKARQLTEDSSSAIDPVWSADGSQIFFASNRDGELAYYVIDRDGTNIEKLEFPKGGAVPGLGGRTDISPDGRWLAFYAGDRKSDRISGTCSVSEIGNREIYLLATDGSALRKITDGGDNTTPSFSPDGRWISFMSYRDGDSEIFIMRSDGSDVRQMTFNKRCDWQPRWQSGMP